MRRFGTVRLSVMAWMAIVLPCAGVASAQGQGEPPFSKIYKRPVVSPYTMLGSAGAGGGVNQFGGTTLSPAMIYQNQILPQLEQQQQQQQLLRQSRQIGGLQNRVQQIQRSTQSRQIDETIRATGHRSTYLNFSHYYNR
ncbi:MAG: hypothetical protein EBZ59_04215 [Planctomycetia bacterium]|nr:hypothetical protein [Planctomycetia bacterium]